MNGQSAETGQTRREFVKRAAGFSSVAVFGGGLVAACGGDDEAAPETSAGGTAGSATTAERLGPGSLTFVGWEGYDATQPETFPNTIAWMEDQELEITSTYIANGGPEMLSKIQASSPGTYDLTTPAHIDMGILIAAGVLDPIDPVQVPNLETILPVMRDQAAFRGADGTLYGVPFTYSFQTPLYNADRVPPLETLAELVENPEYKGRSTHSDTSRNFTWIAQILGFGNPDPNHITREELEECKEYARRVIANARTLASSLGDILQLMIAGDVDYSTNGTFDQVAEGQAAGVNIDTFFAKEGAQTFVDGYSVPTDSENHDLALAWIDHMLTPEAQAEVAVVYGGAVVNLEAVPLMPRELQERYNYDDIEADLELAPAWPPVPVEGDEFATDAEWEEAWNEAKQG
jgi:putative spermidine/putrescine transport system substrate-binding protein